MNFPAHIALRSFWPLLCALWLVAGPSARAHRLSDGYLTLSAANQRLEGRVELSLHDVEQVIGLDANANGEITWGELLARKAELLGYVQARFKTTLDGQPLLIEATDLQVHQRGDTGYASVGIRSQTWSAGEELAFDYGLLFDTDPFHLGLLKLELAGSTRTGLFNSNHRSLSFSLSDDGASVSAHGFVAFIREGVWHIWIGFDHILFLVALLLPAVFTVDGRGWKPTTAFRPALINVLKVVTAFTVAHSITLSLAVLGVVELPSRLVESTIAASVVVAAANNLKPFFRDRGWIVAFVFGLIHGFGFAGVLGELDLPAKSLATGLVGFNVGVELGQLAIVALFLPAAFALRSTFAYRRVAVQFGSAAICVVAGLWCMERIFGLGFMPF